jgi:hypothetical protein
MKMTTDRIKQLAGYLVEEASVPSFGLEQEENAKEACIAIAKAGVAVDMEYFMEVFYFNFKSKKEHDIAAKAVAKKIQGDEPQFIKESLIREFVGPYDPQATQKEAERLEKLIKDQFHVKVETQSNKDGSITLTVNNGHMTMDDDNNPAVLSVTNFSKAIDKDYYDFRKKGWYFSQPAKGSFTIGVPQ